MTMIVLEEVNIVENFNDLNNWTNTTYSGYDDPWFIVSGGYNGYCAKSECGGMGYGDQLTQTFDFATDVVATLWITIPLGGTGGITVSFVVDGDVIWSENPPYTTWIQKTANIPAGVHEIRIETDFAGAVLIDELEITSD